MEPKRSEGDDQFAHQEVQAKSVARHTSSSVTGVTTAEFNRILRKVDLRVIPVLAVLYLLSFLDRGNCPPSA